MRLISLSSLFYKVISYGALHCHADPLNPELRGLDDSDRFKVVAASKMNVLGENPED